MACEGCRKFLKHHAFSLVIYLALILALICGIAIKETVRAIAPEMLNDRVAMHIGFIGELYVRALNTIALPLLMFTLIYSIGTMKRKVSGLLGLELFVYIVVTKLTALCIAVGMSMAIRPGRRTADVPQVDVSDPKDVLGNATLADHFLDIVRNLIPGNVVEMTVRQSGTILAVPVNENGTEDLTIPMEDWAVGAGWIELPELLAVTFIAMIVGASMSLYATTMKDSADLMTSLIYCFCQMALLVTSWVHWATPIGVFFLITKAFFSAFSESTPVVAFLATLIICSIIQLIIIYPIIYVAIYRRSHIKFMPELMEIIFTALATRSAIATLPIAIETVERRLRFDKRATRFILPAAAVLNNDGDLIFICVSSFFIAQFYGVALTGSTVTIIASLSVLASLTNAGIARGTVMSVWVFVLSGAGIGIDAQGVALLFLGNVLFGNLKTVLNVVGDCYGLAAVIGVHTALFGKISDDDENAE